MLDILRQRRSVRTYQDRPVEQEKIDALVTAALLAPSSRSIFPCSYIVVAERARLRALAEAKQFGSSFLDGAPLAIAVVADTGASDVWVEDASIAAFAIQLAAESEGLSSCWIQIRNRMHNDDMSSNDYVRGVLALPDSYAVASLIAVGYANEEKVPHTDDDLRYGQVYKEVYGQS